MILKLLSIILFFISLDALACEYRMKNNYIRTLKTSHSSVFNHCSGETLGSLLDITKNSRIIPMRYLDEVSRSTVKSDRDTSIHVFIVEKEISKLLSNNIQLIEMNIPNFQDATSSNKPIVECLSCTQVGTSSIKIIIDDRTYYGQVRLGIEVPAFVVKANYMRGTQLDNADTEAQRILTDRPDEYEANHRFINNSTLNRNLLKGEAIKKSFLSKKQLVSSNSIVQVVMNNQNIEFKTTALALSAGGLDDQITVRIVSNNKILNAKVIDQNKVSIEL